MAILDRFKKQPAERLQHSIDYTDWLPTGVTVLTVVTSSVETLNSTASDVGEPTLTITTPSVTGGNVATYFATLGTDGKRYKVTFQATMSDTQILESEIEFKVRDV